MSSENDGTIPMVRCLDCDHLVPSGNLMMHQLMACSKSNKTNTRTVAGAAALGGGGGGSASSMHVYSSDEENHNNDNQESSPADVTSPPRKARRQSSNGPRLASSSSSAVAASSSAFALDLTSPSTEKQQQQVHAGSRRPRSEGRRRRCSGHRNTQPEEIRIADSDEDDSDGDDSYSDYGMETSDSVEVIDLVDSSQDVSTPVAAPAAAGAATAPTQDLAYGDEDDDMNPDPIDEWACAKCTLLNDMNRANCEACHHRNPSYIRPPDASRRERLIGGTSPHAGAGGGGDSGSPFSYVGGGALLGGLVGAAGNYVQGRSVASGFADGAMTGAVGGALLHNVAQASSSQQQQQQQGPMTTVTHTTTSTAGANLRSISAARSASALGMASYPSNDVDFVFGSGIGGSRQRPRHSYRSVRTTNPDGSVTTTTTGGGRTTQTTTPVSRRHTATGFDDPMMNYLLHQQLAADASTAAALGRLYRHGGRYRGYGGFGGGAPNVDGMSYEQLLERFGDGTENQGAEERHIRRLPVKKLEDPQKELPVDARQCMICLEEFEKGEDRMMLPCLHGFHEPCCKKWLRQNGSCPVCKMRVDQAT